MEDNPFFITLWLVCAAATVGAAVFAHRTPCELRAVKRRAQVDVDHLAPVFRRDVEQVVGLKIAGAVDQHVDAAKRRQRLLKVGLNVLITRQITFDHQRVHAQRAGFFGGVLGFVVGIPVMDDYVCACAGKSKRDPASHAARASGHIHDLDVQVLQHVRVPLKLD